MSLRKLSELRRAAEKELKELGFSYPSVMEIMAGKTVFKSADSEEEAKQLVEKYQNAGLRSGYWLSNGSHGYPDEYKINVGL